MCNVKIHICNLDRNWLLCILADSHTFLSHGDNGMTGHRTGMAYYTVHHRYQVCILGDNEVNSERMWSNFSSMSGCRQ